MAAASAEGGWISRIRSCDTSRLARAVKRTARPPEPMAHPGVEERGVASSDEATLHVSTVVEGPGMHSRELFDILENWDGKDWRRGARMRQDVSFDCAESFD